MDRQVQQGMYSNNLNLNIQSGKPPVITYLRNGNWHSDFPKRKGELIYVNFSSIYVHVFDLIQDN